MGFSDDIDNFSSKFLSGAAKLQESQISKFLIDTLGKSDADLIVSIHFDGEINKFTSIDAPDHVIKKIAEAGYYDL